MPPGCRLWREDSILLVFLVVFFARTFGYGGGDPAKLSAMDFGELEIVFDAVVMGEGTRLFWCSLEPFL